MHYAHNESNPLSLLPCRSFLFVPGNRPDRFEKAQRSGAHQIIIDLEDAVAPADKAAARDNVANWEGRDAIIVRINGLDTPWFGDDVKMARESGIGWVMAPKAEPQVIETLGERLDRKTSLTALIETVEGFVNIDEISRKNRVKQLAFGNLDFSLDAGIREENRELDPVRLALVLASRRAKLAAPIDGVTPDWSNADLCREDVKRARSLGFGGKLCIHPSQVVIANEGFLSSPKELEWARRILEAVRLSGDGVTAVDGKMVDRPVIARANIILAEHGLATEIK